MDKIEEALDILFREYHSIVNTDAFNADAKAGYLCAVCAVDLRIPSILNAKPFSTLFPLIRERLDKVGVTA